MSVISSDGLVVSVTGNYCRVLQYDEDLIEIGRIPTETPNWRCVCTEEEGELFVSDFRDPFSIIKYESGVATTEMGQEHHQCGIKGLAVYRDFVISAASNEHAATVWNHAKNGHMIGQLRGTPRYTSRIHSDGTGAVFVGGSSAMDRNHGAVLQYELRTLQKIGMFIGHSCEICDIKSTDSLVVSCGMDNSARVWDKKTRTQIREIDLRCSFYLGGHSLEFLDNEIFVGLNDGSISKFDMRKGGILATFKPHESLSWVEGIEAIGETHCVSIGHRGRVVTWNRMGKVQQQVMTDYSYGVCVWNPHLGTGMREDEEERMSYLLVSLPSETGRRVSIRYLSDDDGRMMRFAIVSQCFFGEECH